MYLLLLELHAGCLERLDNIVKYFKCTPRNNRSPNVYHLNVANPDADPITF